MSGSMRAALWVSAAVCGLAVGNWAANLLHWYWHVRVWRIELGTWMGSVEVGWRRADLAVAQPSAFLGPGGMSGRRGLLTSLSHMVWVPGIRETDNYVVGASSLRGFTGPPGWGRVTVVIPAWILVLVSGGPMLWILRRERRRREGRLCDRCGYSLVGLPGDVEGRVKCPECARSQVLP